MIFSYFICFVIYAKYRKSITPKIYLGNFPRDTDVPANDAVSNNKGFHAPAEKMTHSEYIHMTPNAGQTHIRTIHGVLLQNSGSSEIRHEKWTVKKVKSSLIMYLLVQNFLVESLGIEPEQDRFDTFKILEESKEQNKQVEDAEAENASPKCRMGSNEWTWKN